MYKLHWKFFSDTTMNLWFFPQLQASRGYVRHSLRNFYCPLYASFLLMIRGPTLSPVSSLCCVWEPSHSGNFLDLQQRQYTALSPRSSISNAWTTLGLSFWIWRFTIALQHLSLERNFLYARYPMAAAPAAKETAAIHSTRTAPF